MDDQQTYLLNGLLTRHFGLGRIVRFRLVQRGRQPESYEVFTAQEKEYLVQLYPPTYSPDQLNFAANSVNTLDQHRFSVMPFVLSKQQAFAAEGPQQSRMLVSLAPIGSALAPAEYTLHVSQIGLRLAWMHRLLREQIPKPPDPADPVALLRQRGIPFPDLLTGLSAMARTDGWVHGDIQNEALLHDGDHQLRSVVDWGQLHWGDPLEDVVDAFVEVAMAPSSAADRTRGIALLEAYATLVPIKRRAWTPVVARWCAQRLLHRKERPLPGQFEEKILAAPERLATAIASCL